VPQDKDLILSQGNQKTGAQKTRAIVCFIEENKHLIQQALALRQSWLYVRSPDTDLVVMGPPAALRSIPDDVVKIEQRVVADDPEWLDFRCSNSVACLNGVNAWQLDRYSHLLLTDVDTFITPAWNRFYPDHFVCGNGGYSNNDEVRRRIREIAAEFGLKHRGLTNTGSTWYGPTPLLRRMAAMTEMLLQQVLSRFREDPGEWPGWYKGVSLLYAAEIAINHLAPDAEKSNALDFYSTSRNSIQDHPHIHCWHTDDKFSKHHFVSGRYSVEDTKNLNLDIIADYAMEMSFRSLPDLAATYPEAAREMGGSPPPITPPAEATQEPDLSGPVPTPSANPDDSATADEIALRTLQGQTAGGEPTAMSEYHDLALLLEPSIGSITRQTPVAVSEADRLAWAAMTRRCRRVTAAREQCIDQMLATFAEANVRTVLLRDAALAHMVYFGPPPCLTADIDILVAAGDIERAVEIACELGYTFPLAHTSRFAGSMHHLPAAWKLQSGFEVLLRIHDDAIASDSPDSLTLASLTAPPRLLRRGAGETALALGHADMLRHLAGRAFEPALTVSPKHLYEFRRYAKVFGKEIDWGDIEKCFPHVNVALHLASLAFDEEHPKVVDGVPFKAPRGIGRAMMPLSTIAKMPIAARLNALFNPSAWWLHGFYGVPAGNSLLFCRTIRHPSMLVRWLTRRLLGGANLSPHDQVRGQSSAKTVPFRLDKPYIS
jgi:hypothetical protein